jgi:hypothetical protein
VSKKTLAELLDDVEPGIKLVLDWAKHAARPVEVLPVDTVDAERTLVDLQITTRSPLGAIAYETGGILVDNGWLRVLGAGDGKLPRTISTWNGLSRPRAEHRLPGALLVADDVVGGFFAINGGAFAGPLGNLFYLAPDTVRWEDLELGHTAWLNWVFTGDLAKFYETMRWEGWEGEVAALPGDQCIDIFPPLWTKADSMAARSRRPVPIENTWGLNAIEYPRQLNG